MMSRNPAIAEPIRTGLTVESSAGFPWPRKVDLFGVGISVTTYTEAVSIILEAARRRIASIVACQAVHAVITASRDQELGVKVNSFDLVTPDGQPVRWAMNLLHGTGLADRIYGPDLMLRLCGEAARQGVSIFLYGGTPQVLQRLRENLLRLCPPLQIAGMFSPPFRPLTPREDAEVIMRINASGAGLVFIGLGCPKQDHFAFAHKPHLRAVLLCVGAAFDFCAGVKRSAPPWMQRCGLEWLFRLLQEPKRLWKRYLITNSIFLYELAKSICFASLKRNREKGEPCKVI